MNRLSSPLRAFLSPALLAPALLLLPLLACGGGSDGGGDQAPKRIFMSLGTAPPGGTFFVVGGALAEVLNESGPEGWQATAEATAGSQENIRRLAAGELDLALSNAAISYFAARGEGGWDRAYPIRSVMTLAPNVALFITPAGSGIESIEDLKGQRVVIGPEGAGFHYFVRPLLAAHGVSFDDFTPIYGTQTAAVDMLADGSAAAAFLGGGQPTPSITQASSSRDIRFVPFDEDALAQLFADYPFFQPATIPAGTYRNQDEPFHGLAVGYMHLITSADADDARIREVVRTIWEHRDAVVARHAAGKAINPKNVARDTGVERHPGAEAFYAENSLLPPDDSAEEASEEATAPQETEAGGG